MTRLPIRSSVQRRRSLRVSDRLSRFAGVAIVAVALSGCAGIVERTQYEGESAVTVPPGAIQVGDDYYMVPSGTDADGCPQFSPWSSGNLVQTALFYRKADGSFTVVKEQSACVAG